jgi:hypothetical protein
MDMDGIKFSGREMFRHLNLASLTSWYEFKPGRGASPLTTMPGEKPRDRAGTGQSTDDHPCILHRHRVADLVKSMQAKSKPVAQKGKVA